MTADHPYPAILAGLRSRLTGLATAYGAELEENHNGEGHHGRDIVFVLHPRAPGATTITIFPESEHMTWIEVGRDVLDEIPTSARHPVRAVDDVLEVVEAVAAGRARQRSWYADGRPERLGPRALADPPPWVRSAGCPLRPLQLTSR